MFTISSNDDGSSDGTFTGHPSLGLCFTPTVDISVTSFEVRWGSSGLSTFGRHVSLRATADINTALSSGHLFDYDPSKANTWEVVTLDSPVTLTAGIEYFIAIDDESTGVAFKAVGTSTFVDLTSTRFLKDSPPWSGSQSGFTGGFRLHGDVPVTGGWGVGHVRMGAN